METNYKGKSLEVFMSSVELATVLKQLDLQAQVHLIHLVCELNPAVAFNAAKIAKLNLKYSLALYGPEVEPEKGEDTKAKHLKLHDGGKDIKQ